MRRFWFHLLLFSLSVGLQAQTPSSDPQAVALAAQSVTAMTGGTAISDVTLNGTAIRTVGSDQDSGAATLLAKGFGKSRVDLNLSAGVRSEIRNSGGDPDEGNWIGPDGAVNVIALHNCFTDASWFFPALGMLTAASTNPNIVLTYVGPDTLQGAAVQHVQAYTYDPNLPDAQSLSTMNFYLDSQTLLPQRIVFNEHPDNDQTVNLEVGVIFSDYRAVAGAAIPFHIQRYVNNSLSLDVQLMAASVNSGLADNPFGVQ